MSEFTSCSLSRKREGKVWEGEYCILRGATKNNSSFIGSQAVPAVPSAILSSMERAREIGKNIRGVKGKSLLK
jgi:hypothetical protein